MILSLLPGVLLPLRQGLRDPSMGWLSRIHRIGSSNEQPMPHMVCFDWELKSPRGFLGHSDFPNKSSIIFGICQFLSGVIGYDCWSSSCLYLLSRCSPSSLSPLMKFSDSHHQFHCFPLFHIIAFFHNIHSLKML